MRQDRSKPVSDRSFFMDSHSFDKGEKTCVCATHFLQGEGMACLQTALMVPLGHLGMTKTLWEMTL